MLTRLVLTAFIAFSAFTINDLSARIPPRVSKPKNSHFTFYARHPAGVNPMPPYNPYYRQPYFFWDGYYFYNKPVKRVQKPVYVKIHQS